MGSGSGGAQGLPAVPCVQYGACDDYQERDLWLQGPTSPVTIQLKFNVFGDGSGQWATTTQRIDAQVALLNQHFDGSGIQFVKSDPPLLIPDSRFYDFCGPERQYNTCFCLQTCRSQSCPSEESAMKTQYADNPGQKLNIYVVDLAAHTPYAGFGYYPWCAGATGAIGGIVINGAHVGGVGECNEGGNPVDCGVLTHEIGHNLGLYHTHRGVYEVLECSGCWEGSECTSDGCLNPSCNSVGDFCCDTPPTWVNYDCADSNKDDFCVQPPGVITNTDYTNFMGYGPDGCRDHFTFNQGSRMQCWTCDELTGWLSGESPGACTRPDGSCVETTVTCCGNTGGTFRGAGTTCDVGACCLGGAGCDDRAQWSCSTSGGTFLGSGTACESQVFACCLPDGSCIDTTQSCCSAEGGWDRSPYNCPPPSRWGCPQPMP